MFRRAPPCLLSIAAVLIALLTLAGTSGAQETRPPADPSFDILEIQVEGNSVLRAADIERAVRRFLGPQRHFSDVEGARRSLEDLYQKRGYQTVFVDIPEQRVSGGIVRLHVLEGTVGRERVLGSRYYELGEIRSRVPELAPGTVPDFNRMQGELAQANKLPDRQVSPILTPGRTPGTVDVDLSVKDQLPLHADLEVDNHASPFTRAERVNGAIHYDNLWQRHHSIALNYQVAPQAPSEADVLYGTYLWRFADSDDAVTIYGIRSNSNIAIVGSSTILGKATIYGARWIRPVGLDATGASGVFQSLTIGLDRKDFGQTNINALTGSIDVLPPITYTPLLLSYSASIAGESRTAQFSLGPTTAPRGLFGNSDAQFRGRRVLGSASYIAWKFDGSVEQWLGRKWSAFLRAQGQWTADPLIPNEQFVTGGADSVRGYRESEAAADTGEQSTFEFRWYPLGRPGADGRKLAYLAAFYDQAGLRMVDAQGSQAHGYSLASAGLGLHAEGWHGFHVAVNGARALRTGSLGVGGPITRKGEKHVDFSLGWGF